MITTDDVRRASRTGEPLRVGGIELTLDYLIRLPASDWDDWMELRAFAARREAKRLRFAARYGGQRALPAGPEVIEGSVVEDDEPAALPRVRRRLSAHA